MINGQSAGQHFIVTQKVCQKKTKVSPFIQSNTTSSNHLPPAFTIHGNVGFAYSPIILPMSNRMNRYFPTEFSFILIIVYRVSAIIAVTLKLPSCVCVRVNGVCPPCTHVVVINLQSAARIKKGNTITNKYSKNIHSNLVNAAMHCFTTHCNFQTMHN